MKDLTAREKEAQKKRILAYRLARELTEKELKIVAGGRRGTGCSYTNHNNLECTDWT